MFKYRLALRLGRTVSELDQTLSAREFDMWQAFNYYEPIGIGREDSLFGNLACVLARANGVKDVSASDFMLFHDVSVPNLYEQEEIEHGASREEIETMCVNMKAMFSKVV